MSIHPTLYYGVLLSSVQRANIEIRATPSRPFERATPSRPFERYLDRVNRPENENNQKACARYHHYCKSPDVALACIGFIFR